MGLFSRSTTAGTRISRWSVGGVGVAAVLGAGILIGSALTPAGTSGSASAAPPGLVDGAEADASILTSGPEWNPWSPGPGELGANPQAFSIDHVVDGRTVKKVVASWNRNEDSPTAPVRNTRAVAEENGQVFVPYDALPQDFTMVATARLHDGSVLSASFVPVTAPAPNRFGIPMARSTDVAETWETWTAPLIEDKWKLSWYRVHRDLVELPDGTLLLGGYGSGTINGVANEYSLLFESTDGGKTFRQRAAINAGSEYGTNELGFARTSDGRLIAVMRGREFVPRPPAQPMTVSFSDDDGVTWEPLTRYVPPEGFPDNGIMPELVLQPNGQLLMSYGRPDNNVVVSRDGTGRTWDAGDIVYSRHPGADPLRRWMGSSGNMDLVPLNASSALAFGDTCHNIWWCREYGHDNKIWTTRVDALGPGAGRLDLASKVLGGTVALRGDVEAADARFPEHRIEAAVDGSSEYRAAARFAGDDQTLVIELDQPYTLERIGLMMDTGLPNSANVQLSEDGRRWGRPVVQTGDRTDYAMRYTDFEPKKAKFVKISAGRGAPLTAVTELELYAEDVLTFENDAFNATPRTLKDTRYAFAADANPGVPDYNFSRTHLVLVDADQAARASATFPARRPAETQHLSFGYEGYGYGTGALWDILGTDASGEEVTAFRLHFGTDPAGKGHRVRAWNGTDWVDIGTAGPFVPNKVWMTITVDSTAEETTVSMNGTVMGTTDLALAEVSEFTGFRAETGLDPADVGNMEHAYDDVVITPGPR